MGHLRLLRAGAFALAALVLAVLAHRAGGGTLPGAAAIAVVAVALFAGAYALAGRRRTPRQIALLVGGSQLVLHAVLESSGEHSPSIVGCVAHDAGSPAATAAMWICHALAAGAVAILLERGERWAFATIRAVARAARALRPPAEPRLRAARAAICRAAAAAHLPAWRMPLSGGRSTCGPPAAA